MKRSTLLTDLCIIVLGSLLFITGIGGVRLFDWDEINFAESAREMVLTGDWFNVQINFESFWEKPPLFIWMQALSMKVFGVGEFAARFPNAIMGIITLLTLFHIGTSTENRRFGLLWAGLYTISFLPFFYFKSGIIDPWFNYFIFLGIYFFARYSDQAESSRRLRNASLSGLFTGLAVLTKGPVAFLIFGLTFLVWLIFRKFRFSFRWKDVAAYLVMLALAGGAWFIALAATGHSEVIKDFIDYQIRLFETKDAGHGGFLLYHFVILLFGVTPASFFALSTFRRKALKDEDPQSRSSILFRWMMVSLWVVLILFTIVRTKIVHYSSFCYFPITFLGAWAASRMMDGKLKFTTWHRIALIATSAFYGIVLTGLTLFDKFKQHIIPLVDDPFAVSCMEASSHWHGFEPFVGILLIAATIAFCVWFKRSRKLLNFLPLAAGNLLFAMTAILCAVPEVEKYSQASAIDFYIERQGEDCYVLPSYFKSYAQYFYTDRQPECNCDDFEWLSKGPIDKPCYFVVKDIPEHVQRLREDVPDARFLQRRSGFQFFVREKPSGQQDTEADQGKDSKVE
ncbi:MAG: glycosyltransferase family 39 protein [Bacteroidales bacterium]|nr:glycosyltransferase family 39 protein [Bacteroidales bacterium]